MKKERTQSKVQKKKITFLDLFIILIILAGFGAISYPFISDAYASYHNQKIIDKYQDYESKKNKASIAKTYQSYVEKNKEIAKNGQTPGIDPFKVRIDPKNIKKNAEKSQLESTIAELEIPSINASLPVFDHTNDWLLQYGACLLDGSSYPTGGKNTHAVISAHRGVPNARLFTDLPKLKKGDQFFIRIANHTLAYEVISKKVVEPTEISTLKIVPGQDLVTLFTCTPYMVNSHRLLVTGKRIPLAESAAGAIQRTRWFNQAKIYACLALTIAILIWMWFLLKALIIGRNEYKIVFTLTGNNSQEITSFNVIKRGLFGKKNIHQLELDESGKVDVSIRGGKYKVVDANNQGFKIKVKNYHDENFTLSSSKFYAVKSSGTDNLVSHL